MLTNPGKLDRRAEILAWTSEQDGSGLRETYTTIATVWARLEPVGALTYWFGKQQLDTAVTHRITIRRTGKLRPETLTGRMCVVIDGSRYNILRSSDLEGERRFTVLDVCLEENLDEDDGGI